MVALVLIGVSRSVGPPGVTKSVKMNANIGSRIHGKFRDAHSSCPDHATRFVKTPFARLRQSPEPQTSLLATVAFPPHCSSIANEGLGHEFSLGDGADGAR
jgi:hypothetical protein